MTELSRMHPTLAADTAAYYVHEAGLTIEDLDLLPGDPAFQAEVKREAERELELELEL